MRESIDARSRSDELVRELCAQKPLGSLSVLDLACGTGANFRYLAPRLRGSQEWVLIDHDAELLAAVQARIECWAQKAGLTTQNRSSGLTVCGPDFRSTLRQRQIDLVTDIDRIPFEDFGLVTASALLDLVAFDWLDRLVQRCRQHNASVLFAMTYDGCVSFSPTLADDTLIIRLVNQHQAGDKGFGAALGPSATAEASRSLAGHGYQISTVETPWCLGPRDTEVQQYLLRDWAQAATAIAPELSARITTWRGDREHHVAGGKSSVRVGHRDLLGIPSS